MTTYEIRLQALLDAVRDIAHLPHNANLPPLFLFTDPERTPDPIAIAAHMPAGSGMIYRHFGAADRLQTAQTLRRIASERGLVLLVGEDAELTKAVSAHGVHLREASRDHAHALKAAHPEWLLTAACHNLETAQNLPPESGLSALFASPVYASKSPSAIGKAPLGTAQLNAIIAATPLPVYALGGINTDTITQLAHTGVAGVGAVEAFLA